jgi:SAM-dependent methyltransferase
MDRTIRNYLEQLLGMFWLRPETALWRTLDCMLMHKEAPKGRGADFGCGDGLLSYVMAGGRVRNYDVFMNVANRGAFRKGADIYNSKARIKPQADGSSLRYKYAYGIDHKAGLIDKAGKYEGFYGATLIRDLNRELPFNKGHFDWGFSNILYWLNEPGKVLKEWGRVIKKSGKLYLFVPNENFKERAWLYYKAPHKGEKAYLNYFDRGYNSLIHHYYTGARWERMFKKSGYRVVSHRPYMSSAVMDIWNIGTRPISHLLIDMAARLKGADRNAVKSEWIKFFRGFFEPIIPGELSGKRPERECAFHFYVLENNR